MIVHVKIQQDPARRVDATVVANGSTNTVVLAEPLPMSGTIWVGLQGEPDEPEGDEPETVEVKP